MTLASSVTYFAKGELMQRETWIGVLGLGALALVACSSSTGGTTSGSGAGGSSGGCGAGMVQMTVLNQLAWCSVSIAGGTASTDATVTACVPDGTVTLTAQPENSTFELGDWYGVDGDTGSGSPGMVSGTTSTATITVSGTSQCVSVCCPFTSGMGCPGMNTCP
jgi:hypothetical protein